ncbi:MAG: preprotein translocase subunit SecE [Carboxydocellales bacterium]
MAEAKESGKLVKKETKEPAKKEAPKKELVRVNRIEDLKKFFSGTKSELRKVHWPDRQQVITYTSVVLVTVALMAVLIWVADLGLSALLQILLKK